MEGCSPSLQGKRPPAAACRRLSPRRTLGLARWPAGHVDAHISGFWPVGQTSNAGLESSGSLFYEMFPPRTVGASRFVPSVQVCLSSYRPWALALHSLWEAFKFGEHTWGLFLSISSRLS